ncbi:hypothetical protein ACP70R_022611 [Stipagrostis hirtigluma subsp. patula]
MDHAISEMPREIPFHLLEEITDKFSEERELGSGAFGKVYMGVKKDGEKIAVKKIHGKLGLEEEQFRNEFRNLARLQHQNIVRLVGYCYEIRKKYIEHNGRLLFADDIYENHGFDWHTRYAIIKGICEGLKYLHEDLKPPIYHLDLKPANILLDENMVPKIADFGLSRLFEDEQTRITKSCIGTRGYLPPEYIERNLISKKFDIFGLGVVVIKIMTGPTGYSKSAEMSPQQFIDLVHENWRNRLQSLPTCELELSSEQVKRCIKIALSCVETDRNKRPSIGDIVHELNETEDKECSHPNALTSHKRKERTGTVHRNEVSMHAAKQENHGLSRISGCKDGNGQSTSPICAAAAADSGGIVGRRRTMNRHDICCEVFKRLVANGHEASDLKFHAQLEAHFERLPLRYLLEVNVDKADDVLIHQKVLEEAKDPDRRPAFAVRLLQCEEIRVDDLASNSRSRGGAAVIGDAYVRSETLHTQIHRVIFSMKPRNLTLLASSLGDIGLSIKEAHSFLTVDDYSLDIFDVEGWPTKDANGLHKALETSILRRKKLEKGPRYGSTSEKLPPFQEECVSDIDKKHLFMGKKVASGSCGDTFLGTCFGKEVAISVLNATNLNHSVWDEFRKQFYKLRELDHANIVQMIGTCTKPQAIITECISGGSLFDFLHNNHVLDISNILKFALDVSRGMSYLHQKDIIHRECTCFLALINNSVWKIRASSVMKLMLSFDPERYKECISGGSLFDFLHNNHALDISNILKFALDISRGMSYLHQKDIIHRELRSANLLMDKYHVVKVANFSLARFQDQGGGTRSEIEAYQWMAPEVLNYQPYDNKADVYSFAIVLWELMTSKIPYNAMSPCLTAVGVTQQGLRPELPENTHPRLLNLMQRCWDAIPSNRPSFSDIVTELEDIELATHAQISMDSDDALSLFSDDDNEYDICADGGNKEELADDPAVDESIFQLIKKHQIKKLKRRLGSAFLSDLSSKKSNKKGNHGKSNFSQMCSKCFSDVINALSSDQIAVIERFGFGCALRFASCGVPKCFVKWISSVVDVRTSELVFKDRVIPFTKQSVHKILGVPVGGEILVGDYEAGKSFLLSKFGVDSVHSILFFADKLTAAHDLTDEEVFICFMIVAIGCFFCPDSSYEPLTKLVHILEHPNDVRKYDWSLYLYDLALDYVPKLQKQLLKPKNDSIVMCSSAYIFAVMYLDCLNLGSHHVSPEIPRTSFWNSSSIKFCSQLDEIKPGKYGRRPLKHVIDTSYSQNIEEILGVGVCSPSFVVEFNSKLESLYGHVLPEELKLGITHIYAAHCVEQLKRTERSCEDLLFKIFSFCNEISEKVKYDNSVCEEQADDGHLHNGDVRVNVSVQDFFEKVQESSCVKNADDDPNVVDCLDLSLKVGFVANVGKAEMPTTVKKINNDIETSGLEVFKSSVQVQDKSISEANDVLVSKELGALPQPADAPVVKPKKYCKGVAVESKPALFDLNTSAFHFGSQDFITPNDNVIEIDTLKKMAEVKDIFDVGESEMYYVPNVFDHGSKLVFDVETQQYVRVRNDVHKEKLVSKSRNFLSKLQIRDLNVPLVQSEELTQNGTNHGQVNVGFVPVTTSVEPHNKKCSVLRSKGAVGFPEDFVCVPDSDDENNLPGHGRKSNDVIDLDQEDGNDVKFLGEVSFKDKIRSMCKDSEVLYNKNLDLGANFVNNECAGPSVVEAVDLDSKVVRAVFQQKSLCRPIAWSSKFGVTDKLRRNYLAACRLASSTKWNEELGNSLRTGCKVGSYVIHALCRKFFMDKRPTISRKHYFFSGVGAILLKGCGSISYVKKCFDGAASVLPLHKADMLLFPICHDDHWFVFIVDIKNTLFVFLDSYYSGDDDYHVFVRSNLIPSFKRLWNELVNGPIDFEQYDIVYPSVPKQNNLVDCGIFVIMFLTFWTWYCGLCVEFSQDDIDNIRIYTLSSLVCSEHNIAYSSPITNYFGPGSFPRVGEIRKATVQ